MSYHGSSPNTRCMKWARPACVIWLFFNISLKDSNLPEDIRIGAVLRAKKIIIPRSDFVFEKDDLVVFLAKRELLKEVENIFRISSI